MTTTEPETVDRHDEDAVAEHPAHRRRRHRGWRITGVVVIGLVLAVSIVSSATPWPSAMLIRAVFEQGGQATMAEMQPYVPDAPLRAAEGVVYAEGSPDTTLDAFTPAAEGAALPTVVWVHGGAWISGSSDNVDPYLRILANRGYTAIAPNYTLGPEGTYPTAVGQLNDALAYIVAHADELGVDPNRIILAGDSAGAQLASQLATLTTNAEYAQLLGIQPALQRTQLIGIVLNCGVYDMRAMAELNGIAAWGFKIALWAYTGTKSWSEEASGAMMSTIDFATGDFPPTFISGGNGDGLTWLQSIPMAQRLKELGVDVTTLFWPATHEPALAHEYQFHLDRPEAQEALTQTEAFLDRVSAPKTP